MTAPRAIRAGLALVGLLLLAPLPARVQAPSTDASPTDASPAGASLPAAASAPAPVAAPLPTSSAAPGSPLAPDQSIPPPVLEAFVDGVVRQAMADHHLAGVTVSVVQDGQTVLKKGYGFASLSPYRPVDPDRTLFRIGSLSKTFTWLLALKEIEAGRIRLDGPINLYLPESLRIPDQGFRAPIRVRDLMNHTPGFESRSLGQLEERDYARVRTLDDYLRQERPARVREPETEMSSSNYGVALAGAAVAEVTGRPFERLVESEITGPLHMERTSFLEPHAARAGMPPPLAPSLAGDMAEGYRWTRGGLRLRPFEYLEQIAPSSAASSTAGDMARYMAMLLGDGVLDGARIYGPLATRILDQRLPAPIPGARTWRGGFAEYPLPGGLVGLGQDGETLSFHAAMTLVPRLRLGVFVADNTNTGGALAQALAARIVQRFYASPPGPPATGSESLLARRAAFEGAYRSTRRAYHGLEGFIERISTLARVTATDEGRLDVRQGHALERLTPDGDPARGVFLGDDGFRRTVFQLVGGQAIRFIPSGGATTYDRVAWWDENRALIAATLATGVAALWSLAGLSNRGRRDFRESSSQSRAGFIQTTQAFLWIVAFGLFAVWSRGARDPAALMYEWPDVTLIVASSCALVASVMSLPSIILLPLVWRGGRRLDSWNALTKLRYTLTALIFLSYAVLLALWGALEPWSA